MENRNIYKTDDFLIIISYIMIIPLGVIAWPWLRTYGEFDSLTDYFASAPLILGPRLTALAIYGSAAISAQIIGRVIRHGERQSLEILDTLQFYKNTTVTQLSSQLDLSESKVTRLVNKMSRIGSLGITVSGDQVSIGAAQAEPAGYSSYSSAQVYEKPRPENVFPESEASEGQQENSFDTDFKEALKKARDPDLSDEERKKELQNLAASFKGFGASGKEGAKKFNFILFIFLFLTPLWPFALVYAISFAVKQQKSALADRNKID
ncbi:hypothetical protein [Spirochaeta isovalerica]|uniref:DNA-binding Lrp family transcriptional regulator n=1 Tax=Spirochaeta isovalerica TaxID=150 RepID=A0A841RCF9_9SPIO|nr:hypothetical protein [Spirochaeta isovalerica]MBB6480559.1 DNA-binding Lrp family transcriptional regulator [Spirochaeta isovalerica]